METARRDIDEVECVRRSFASTCSRNVPLLGKGTVIVCGASEKFMVEVHGHRCVGDHVEGLPAAGGRGLVTAR